MSTQIIYKSLQWGENVLSLQTGEIANQADAAVVVSYGDTKAFVAITINKETPPLSEEISCLPLTVQFTAKAYARGKIPGGFFKREGKPSDREVLTARLIDRSIRPLFPSSYNKEVYVACNLLTEDNASLSSIVSIIATSAALAITGIPISSNIAAAHVSHVKDNYTLNCPTTENTLDLILAGNKQGVLMAESSAHEFTEQAMLEAIVFGHKELQPVIALIEEFAKEVNTTTQEDDEVCNIDNTELYNSIQISYADKIKHIYTQPGKKERSNALKAIRKEILNNTLEQDSTLLSSRITNVVKSIEQEIITQDILTNDHRIGNRNSTEVRPISIKLGDEILPKAHGAALLTRGETQALVIATIGSLQDGQIVDDYGADKRENFLLHYNFPPYCVGEAGPTRLPGRREVGHGKLAWRAIYPLLPSTQDFPYTIRIVSEIMGSDGSSSMATVCGTSLALMDAGIPIKKPVAGIAMGLVKEEDGCMILSDISGEEDSLGKMDFKVAGTMDGITALQMDIKLLSLDIEVIERALLQAKESRMHILQEMNKHISTPRVGFKAITTPIVYLDIPTEKIKSLIGTKGSVIRSICETSGAKIDIDREKNIVVIQADNRDAVTIAENMVKDIVHDPEYGVPYTGEVVKVTDFGVFVKFSNSKQGLVHISEMSDNRITTTHDVIQAGESVKIIILGLDRNSRFVLSMRRVDQETGELKEGYTPYTEQSYDRDNHAQLAKSRRRSSGNYSNNKPQHHTKDRRCSTKRSSSKKLNFF